MNRSPVLLLLALAVGPPSGIAAPDRPPEAAAVEAIVERLAADEDHAFLRTLAPAEADCRAVFRRPADAELACAFARAMYRGLDAIPDDAMKPPENGAVQVVFASPPLVEAGMAHPVFAPWAELATRLEPETALYAFLYLDAGGRTREARSVLVRGAGRWVFVPQWQRAFED